VTLKAAENLCHHNITVMCGCKIRMTMKYKQKQSLKNATRNMKENKVSKS